MDLYVITVEYMNWKEFELFSSNFLLRQEFPLWDTTKTVPGTSWTGSSLLHPDNKNIFNSTLHYIFTYIILLHPHNNPVN